MKNLFITLVMIFNFNIIPHFLNAQNLLNEPESMAYDSLYHRYLAVNYLSGTIVQIDSAGNQSYFVQGHNTLTGLIILDSVVYAGCNKNIKGFHLSNGALVFNVQLIGAGFINDLAADTSGNIYAGDDNLNKIYKIRLKDQYHGVFANSNIITPNGMCFDAEHNRIILMSYRINSPVQAISCTDSTVTEIKTTNISLCDGLIKDKRGFYFVSSLANNSIYRFNNDFTGEPLLVHTFEGAPGDIGYNQKHDIMAVPFLNINNYYLFPLDTTIVNFLAETQTGHAPQIIHFTSHIYTIQNISNYHWDFDNDGNIDSHDENPAFTYNNPGNYAVTLTTTFANDTIATTKPDYIKIFNGASALEFTQNNSNISLNANQSIELTDSFSIECWVNIKLIDKNNLRIFDKSKIALYLNKSNTSYNDSSFVIKINHADNITSYSNTLKNSLIFDNWMHLALTYHNSNLKFYINGAEQILEQPTLPSGPVAANSTHKIIIGNATGYNMGFKGSIDEFRIWGVVRSENEINLHLNHYIQSNSENLWAYWKMDEGKGDSIYDNTLNSINGIIANCNWIEGKPLDNPVLIKKKVNKQNSINVYPNPFNQHFYIEIPSIDHKAIKNIKVSNTLGALINASFYFENNMETTKIHVQPKENMPAGIYQCILFYSNDIKKIITLIKL